ncbi:MAG: TorF family putative porin [Hyphococcus sp.]
MADKTERCGACAAAARAAFVCGLSVSGLVAPGAGPAYAAELLNDGPGYEIAASFAVDSVGVFRGQKSTSLNPTVGASLTIERGDVYGGVFATPTKIAGEVRPLVLGYGGYGSSIGDLDWNVGARYYAFPDSSVFAIDLDSDGTPENVGRRGFFEGVAGLGYSAGPVDLACTVLYSPDVFGETGGAAYIVASAKAPLPYDVDLRVQVARSEFAEERFNDEYTDYAVGLYREVFGINMFVRYSDTVGRAGFDDRVLVFGFETSWTLASSDRNQARAMRKIRNTIRPDKTLFLRVN